LVSHNGTGRGDESDVRWGQYQPVGTLIYNGKNYGCKTFTSTFRPCYYFLKGSNEAVRTTSGEIFKAKRGSTVDAISSANFLSNIKVAACAGGGSFIKNGQYYSIDDSFNKSTLPFFGKVSDGTYIAGYGAGSKNIVSNVLKYFSGVNKNVLWLDLGDGGGSTQMAFNGEMIFGGKRPISVIIGWA
jgi:exopolysaccharide biosynthesis protein